MRRAGDDSPWLFAEAQSFALTPLAACQRVALRSLSNQFVIGQAEPTVRKVELRLRFHKTADAQLLPTTGIRDNLFIAEVDEPALAARAIEPDPQPPS